MAGQIVCPRCGARDSFITGYLPETCVCRVCQSQLGWREIPGCGPDCRATGLPASKGCGGAGAERPAAEDQDCAASGGTTSNGAPAGADAQESRNNG